MESFRFHDIGGEPFNNGMVHKARARVQWGISHVPYHAPSLPPFLLDIQMIGVQWK